MTLTLSRHLVDTADTMELESTPSVGDRYMQTTHGSPVWIVENVMNVTASRYPLVRLTSEKYPDLMKIVSVSALADQEEFTPAH